MSNDAAAEAAERKRVMEAVAHVLEGAVREFEAEAYSGRAVEAAYKLVLYNRSAITELRTPVGREKNQ